MILPVCSYHRRQSFRTSPADSRQREDGRQGTAAGTSPATFSALHAVQGGTSTDGRGLAHCRASAKAFLGACAAIHQQTGGAGPPTASVAMLPTLRCSKMIKFIGNSNSADPAHSLFSKLHNLLPKLTAPIMPLGQRAGQKFRKNSQCLDK